MPDVTEVNEAVRLENRLTRIEAGIDRNTDALELMSAQVEKQNGRIDKLEDWRIQIVTLYAVLLAAGPFVFYALNRWVP